MFAAQTITVVPVSAVLRLLGLASIHMVLRSTKDKVV